MTIEKWSELILNPQEPKKPKDKLLNDAFNMLETFLLKDHFALRRVFSDNYIFEVKKWVGQAKKILVR